MPIALPLSSTTTSSISVRVCSVILPGRDLAHHRLVGAEQQLLAGLAARVERARHLRAAERAVVEQPAVLARERHALGRRLVDDLVRHLREPVDVRLARAEVAALDRVVEEPEDRVAVVAVVLGGVDPALGGDRVRAPRRVVEREDVDLVAELGQRRGGRSARQAGADDDDLEAPLVGRVHQPHGEAVVRPTPARSSRAGSATRASESIDHSEHHGQRERDVADHDQPAKTIANWRRQAREPAHALEQAPRAVVEVHAERHVRDHVDQRDRDALEGGDDVAVRVALARSPGSPGPT